MTARLSVNPITWWLVDGVADHSRAVLAQAFRELAQLGFTAVKADVPDGMGPQEYVAWLASFGLEPATSLFSSPFDETVDVPAEVERARRFGGQQAALGLTCTMVSSMSLPARMATPAVGAGYDEERFRRAVHAVGLVCEALAGEGLRPLHHSHVGGVFETEREVVRLMDTLGPDVIGFGPDTGHLCWAGADPAAMVRRYADRLGAMHLKDVFADHLPDLPGTTTGSPRTSPGTFHEVTTSRRLWAEPGLGVIDLEAVLAAVPDDLDVDLMIEIDVSSVGDPVESHRVALEWAGAHLGAGARP